MLIEKASVSPLECAQYVLNSIASLQRSGAKFLGTEIKNNRFGSWSDKVTTEGREWAYDCPQGILLSGS